MIEGLPLKIMPNGEPCPCLKGLLKGKGSKKKVPIAYGKQSLRKGKR